ncbi:hypothetical protein GUITHDRAFT_108203 [Guillardia theta CCMP2712]|uniref:EF-hand domain-containing protein n=4 Tax=Guillardia theta TaxID=55529 RepID=L1JCD1_GUITC|nr:hypothetical protein GUITHDRAFT_108203 [Guillardia theta CCMP2712]EKX45745.1 hypothetical protein GUITHDRAFT_108203 [Guillardia theta CCMP2712]|eukprot:XP_005832725.1 hypothetical protein GUITHDRAFT_108203 [Guillardia theta CCMP2712]
MESTHSMMLDRLKEVVDSSQKDRNSLRNIESVMHSCWNRANHAPNVQPLCKDGLLELCAYILNKYLDSDLNDLCENTCGAIYNCSRRLPSSRVVRQRMLSAGIYPLIPRLFSHEVWMIRFYGTLISAHCAASGLSNHQKVICSLESIEWLCKCLDSTLKDEGFGGSGWSIEEVMSAAASLCTLPDNRAGFLEKGGSRLSLQALSSVMEEQGNELEVELRVITLTLARISNDRLFKESCTSEHVELMESLIDSEIIAVKSNIMSVLANVGSEKASLEAAFKQACECASAKWNRSQLSIVGKGRVGKTAFVRAILQKPFEHTESTIGMEGMTCEVSSVFSGKMWWKEQTNIHSELELVQARQAAAFAKGMQTAESDLLSSLEFEAENGDGGEMSEDIWEQGQKSGAISSETADKSMGERGFEAKQSSEPIVSQYKQDLVVECLQDEGSDESIIFELWDYGGQDVFYALFHLFITRFGIFAVLFNMEDLITGDERLQKECLDFIEFWLSTIYLHTSQSSSESCAPIVIVGTHKDIISHPLQHLYISRILHRTFCGHLAWPHVQIFDQRSSSFVASSMDDVDVWLKEQFDLVDADSSSTLELEELQAFFGKYADASLVKEFFESVDDNKDGKISLAEFKAATWEVLTFFPVDNTKGHVDPVIPQILSVVEQVAMNADYIQQRVPYAWIKCLDSIKQSGKDVLKLSEVEEIAAKSGMPMSKRLGLTREVEGMLDYFHNLGRLMHHKEKTLRDYVIARPTDFIIRPATQVVCEHDLHKTAQQLEARKMINEWKSLTMSAVLSRRLLPVLWKDYLQQMDLLELLCVKFGIFIPLKPQETDVSMSFLVPTLLREQQLSNVDNQALSCFLLFSSDAEFLREQKGVVARSDLTSRFVPNSLFASVIGQAIAWSQSTGGMQHKVSKTEATLAFGKHRFLLQDLRAEKCFKLVIFVQNPKNVLLRLLKIIQTVIDRCMPRLRCFACLEERTDEGAEDSFLLDYDTLCQQVGTQQGLWVGTSHLDWSILQSKFSAWLPSKELLSSYDVFFSYRHGPFDSELVEKTYDILSLGIVGKEGRRLEVFYDQVRLKPGRRFDHDFMRALSSSVGAVPIVSLDALQRMFSLLPDSPEDHVLMEWSLILELQAAGRLKFCLPVLLGRVCKDEGGPPIRSFFEDDPISRLPDHVPNKTVAEVNKFMVAHHLTPSPDLEKRTVRDIVKLLSKNVALLLWEASIGHGSASPPDMSDVHARELFGLFDHIASKVTNALEASQLWKEGETVRDVLESGPFKDSWVGEQATHRDGTRAVLATSEELEKLKKEVEMLRARQVSNSACCCVS